MEELAGKLYERAVGLGLTVGFGPWQQLPEPGRQRWLALAESTQAVPPAGLLSRLVAIEQLQQVAVRKQDAMAAILESLLLIGESMSAQLDRLRGSVSRNGDVIDSGITLIKGLAEGIRQLRAEPEQLVALADALDAKADALARAVADNTPAAPPAPTP